jgi:hypothetical protein
MTAVVEQDEIDVVSTEPVVHVVMIHAPDLQVVTVGETGPRGLAGVSGATTTVAFAFGDATPKNIVIAPADKLVLSVALVITAAFDGAGAALQIGVSGTPADLLATTDNDPQTLGTYEVTPQKSYPGMTPLLLTITPGSGASQGAGRVVIEIEA